MILKERCRSCDGTGRYSTYQPGDPGKPCWTCGGKGYVRNTMRDPDKRWAREFAKDQRDAANRSK